MVALLGIALFLLGVLLVLTAGIWGVFLAFQDSTAWGLLCLLLPVVALVFIAKNWRRQAVRNSFSLSLIGLLALMGGGLIVVLEGRSLLGQITIANPEGDEFLGDRVPDEKPDTNSSPPSGPRDSPDATTTTALPQPSPDPNTPSTNAPPILPGRHSSEDYHQTMMVGYDAYNEGDYQTALINFRRALEMKPGDPLATEAIQNTESAIQRQRNDQEEES